MNAITTANFERAPTLTDIVSALGTDDFELTILQFLHEIAGAEIFCVHRIQDGDAEFLGAACIDRRSPIHHEMLDPRDALLGIDEFSHPAPLAHHTCGVQLFSADLELSEIGGHHVPASHPNTASRVILCCRNVSGIYALSVIRRREQGPFGIGALAAIEAHADFLVAASIKHAGFRCNSDNAIPVLTSVSVIEARLRSSGWGLTRRDLQVSARILYGISALGIAAELGLREHTVSTYRKRLYARLCIGSRHELLRRYLQLT